MKKSRIRNKTKIIRFFLFFVILAVLSSCGNVSDSKIIKGNVDLSSEDQTVTLKLSKVFEDRQETVDSLKISKGQQTFSFNIEKEGIYSLGVSSADLNRIYLILQRGQQVQLEIDLKENRSDFPENDTDRLIQKELYQLIEKDNKSLYNHLKLSPEQKFASDLYQDFMRKQESAKKDIVDQPDPLLKQLKTFEYLNYTYFLGTMDYYNDRIPLKGMELIGSDRIFDIIAPDSFFWSYNSQLPLMVLSDYKFPFTLSGFGNSLKTHEKDLQKVILDQKDAAVAGYTAIFTMYSYTLSDEKEELKKYVDFYFKRDTMEYDQEIRSMFNDFFSPDRKIRSGAQLPEYSVPSLTDSTVVYTNASFKNLYLIDFWATWCKPCMKEIPLHQKAYKKYHKTKDFEILSISFDRSPEIVEKFRSSKWEMPWKHAILTKGKKDPLARRMSVSYLPQMILVDGNTNTVIAEVIRLKEGNLEKILQKYYDKK